MHFLNPTIAKNYVSSSQKTRILTETWTGTNIFCPICGNGIEHYENNLPVADFYCRACSEDYELKSGIVLWKKIVDGAYDTMIQRLKSDNNPNFFFLNYAKTYEILNFFVIPKHFFVPEIIEKRRPLSVNARRAGWTGCNVLISQIPESGKIFYIRDWIMQNKTSVLEAWHKTSFLRNLKSGDSKGWTLDVMLCVDKLGKEEFTLQEIYGFESELSRKHPKNRFVKDKIRQQLQQLRDRWYLEFDGNWRYRLV